MKICIHRGSKQIGGSCVEVESCGKRLVVDLGLPLDAEPNYDKYLPDIPGLEGNDNSLLAVIISHLHLDHFGLLSYINKKIPVIMGEKARNILKKVSPFLPDYWSIISEGLNLKSEIAFEIGPFKVTPFLIDHSAYDAYSLLIEADGKKFFYSGDFRIHGRKAKLTERLMSNPPKKIDVLLLEGSSLGRLEKNEAFPSESEIESQLVKTFSKTNGLILVHTSSQNIDRLVTVFRAAKKTERRLIIDLYTAVILEATGNRNIPQSNWPEVALYIPQLQRIQIKNNKWFDILKAHSINRIFIENLNEVAAKSIMLFRPLHIRDLEKADCVKDAIYIYSQWEGYWEQDSYKYLRDWLVRNNIPKISIHTSGHACPDDLKRFVLALKPKEVVPIHTFNPEKYSDLFKNVEIHEDGKWWEV